MDSPKIVIGLGYGDEGKGRTVDFLTHLNPNSVVVRFSGGQQAGHTVIRDGYKHIFSNFGSGTLNNCPTYISQDCTIYPITMKRERDLLRSNGYEPKIIIHPLTAVTTPYEVLANRKDRNNVNDGTCGLGIGKTMHRNISTPHKIYAIDLLSPKILIQKLTQLALLYPEVSYLEHKETFDLFMESVMSQKWDIQDYEYLENKDLVFEGSQGVLLDMDHGVYPHVTYANTTCKNALEICYILGIQEVEIYGVTRSYHTRHGNGPFDVFPVELKNTEHETNVLNEWQGVFKKGKMDYDLLNFALQVNALYADQLPNKTTLVVTCTDQYDGFEPEKVKNELLDDIIFFDSPENKINIPAQL